VLVAGVEEQLGIIGRSDELSGRVELVADEVRVVVHSVDLHRYTGGPGRSELRWLHTPVEHQHSARSRSGLGQHLR